MSREAGTPEKGKTKNKTGEARVLQSARFGVVDASVRFFSPQQRAERETRVPFADFIAHSRVRAVRAVKGERARVRIKNDIRRAWPLYDAGAKGYEELFVDKWEVLSESFGSFLSRRRQGKGAVLVLDVMGTGGFLTQPQYQGIVTAEAAMTLIDHRPEQQVKEEAKLGKHVIAGDVLGMGPWREARQFIADHDHTKMPGFDLITCRPEAGWSILHGTEVGVKNQNTDLVDWMIAQRMYSLVSERGGTLLLKMSSFGNYQSWFAALEETEGIRVISSRSGAVSITKGDNPPKFLPRI